MLYYVSALYSSLLRYIYKITLCVSFHQEIDTHVVFTFGLLWIMPLDICVQCFVWMCLWFHLGVELLGDMIMLFLTFWETVRLFYTLIVLFFISTSNV